MGKFIKIIESLDISYRSINDLVSDGWISPNAVWYSIPTGSTHPEEVIRNPFWFKVTQLQLDNLGIDRSKRLSLGSYNKIYQLVITKGYIRVIQLGSSINFVVKKLDPRTADIIYNWYVLVKDLLPNAVKITIFEWESTRETDFDISKIEDYSFYDLVKGKV